MIDEYKIVDIENFAKYFTAGDYILRKAGKLSNIKIKI